MRKSRRTVGIVFLALFGRSEGSTVTYQFSRALGCALLCFLLGFARSETASAAGSTIFGTGPETEFVGDPTNYELGTYFESSVAGEVTALRVYVGPVEAGNPGTIVGNLWNASGNILESATFSNIVAGWNEVALTTPISISANTVYVVSANTNAASTGLGAYAANSNGGSGFFGGGFSNPPLTAISGDFGSPGTFPTQMFPSTNGGASYFRDVLFTPLPEPPVCGDGLIEGTEACDDGNTVNGDGCSSTCQVESGWTCNGASPSNCTTDLVDLGNAMLDNSTHLEWLKFNQTEGESYNQVLSSSLILDQGWAYATVAQICTLTTDPVTCTASPGVPYNPKGGAAALLTSGWAALQGITGLQNPDGLQSVSTFLTQGKDIAQSGSDTADNVNAPGVWSTTFDGTSYTYHYTGNPYTSAAPPYSTLSGSNSVDLTFSTPLPPNLSYQDVSSMGLTAYSFVDGAGQNFNLTNTNSLVAYLSTDAAGNILLWSLFAGTPGGNGIGTTTDSTAVLTPSSSEVTPDASQPTVASFLVRRTNACGMGPELALAMPLLLWLRSRRWRRAS